MCLILFANRVHPRYHLVLAANRDEFLQRPTAPLDYWKDHPDILAGRDLQQLGTWMGITRTGRFAAITNYRSPTANRDNAPSRGYLVSNYLKGNHSASHYLISIEENSHNYSGFNLIVGNTNKLYYYSNQKGRPVNLQPGIHGLSNHLLNTPWPKVQEGKQALSHLLHEYARIEPEQLIELLQNRLYVADEHLPNTGVGLHWERILSPIFITSPAYGTRSSSALLIDTAGNVVFCERTWSTGQSEHEARTRCFKFKI
jgi:uncharacterized protein with NRDE domain